MFYIGICDGISEECYTILNLCEEYFKDINLAHDYILFSSGEEVLQYCEDENNVRMEILFLDVEMPGISGIELKDAILKLDKIWSIVFVSSHYESILDLFGRKTIGFIPKPPSQEKINKMLTITLNELEEETTVIIRGYDGDIRKILLQDIAYFKASGSYTEIMLHSYDYGSENYFLCSKKNWRFRKRNRIISHCEGA